MSPVVTVIILVLALAATIALAILFLRKKSEAVKNSKFLNWVHDTVNFRSLLIDKILKVLYIFETCVCIIGGLIMFFYGFAYIRYTASITLGGLGLLILGPFVVRILFEMIMMFITLVQNSSDINKKMDQLINK